MNRYPLNSRTLGSGIAVPEKYWSATLNVVVTYASASFDKLKFVPLTSSINVRVTSTIQTALAAYAASVVTIQVATTAATTRIQYLVSSMSATVSSTFVGAVGVAKQFTSAIYTGVTAASSFTRKVYLGIAQDVVDSVVAGFGRMTSWAANQTVQETATSVFGTFGLYAPNERYIMVPVDDRDAGLD